MKKFISKFILATLLSVVFSAPVLAATAKVTYVKGKVEVSRGASWVALAVGDTVSENDTISTGFQSEARINFNGSVMAVPALTRITLETLSTSDSKDNVSVYVNTGAVRSKVIHSEGKKVDYKVRNTAATASVRGTMFDFLPRGKITCHEGAVAVYSTKLYDPSRKTSSKRDEAPADEEPATATTPVDEISDSAPRGALVVGAGQATSFDDAGTASTPFAEAKKNAEKAKNYVKTASDKEAIAAGGNSSATTYTVTTTNGGISVTLKVPADFMY